MGDSGDYGSQGSLNEYTTRTIDTDIVGEEKHALAGSSLAVVEASKDIRESQVSENKLLDRDVDPALLAKIVVGRIVAKGGECDFNDASQMVETMTELAQNGLQSPVIARRGSEKVAVSELDVTVSGLDQFTSWEDSVLAGGTIDYTGEDVSLVSSVVSDPTGILAGNGSVFLTAQDKTVVEGKIFSPFVDMEQASLCGSSLFSKALFCERDKALPDACIRCFTAAEIWEIGDEDLGLQCAKSKFYEDQASLKTGTAELKGSGSCGVQGAATVSQFTQEIDSTVHVAPSTPFSDARQQDVCSAECSASFSAVGKEDKWTTEVDSEEKHQKFHAPSLHEPTIITSEDVIAPAEASEGTRQEASTASASIGAAESASGTMIEEELVYVLKEAGHCPVLIVDDSERTHEIQLNDVLNHRKVGCSGAENELSGSMIEAISVDEAAPSDMGVNTQGHIVPVDAGDESTSTAGEVDVTVSSAVELTGPNKAGAETDVRVDTSASLEEKEVTLEMSDDRASVQDEERNNNEKQLILEETVSREEGWNDIVMEDIPEEESSGIVVAVDGGLQMANGFSDQIQDVTQKEPELAEGVINYENTTVGNAESMMKESELDTLKTLVRNLCDETSVKREELSNEWNTATSENPPLVGPVGSNRTSRSSCSEAQTLELPDVSDLNCEKDNSKWKKVILHGLKLLISVAADIELKQKDTVSSVRGGTELDASEELKGTRVVESLGQTMETQAGTKSKVAVDCDLVVPQIKHPVGSTKAKERIDVTGVWKNDGDQVVGIETLTDLKLSQGACWSEEVKVLETPTFAPHRSDKLQLVDAIRAACLVGSANSEEAEVGGSIITPTIAVDYELEIYDSVILKASDEGGPKKQGCNSSGDGSPALVDEKLGETSVIFEATGNISDSHALIAGEAAEVSGQNVEERSSGSQHSATDGPNVVTGGVKAASAEPNSASLDPQRRECSLGTKVSTARVETPGEKIEAAFRQDISTIFDGSHSFFKNEVEDNSREGDRGQPEVRFKKVLAISTHDFLPVAKRTLPVVPIKGTSPEQAMETTFFSSRTSEGRKQSADMKRARISSTPAQYQDGEGASAHELAQKKPDGVGLSSRDGSSPASCKEAVEHSSAVVWDSFGMVSDRNPTMTDDVADINDDVSSQDGQDSAKSHSLKPAIRIESVENTHQQASEEGHVKKKIRAAVDSYASNLTVVAVKRKLQTKRKKVSKETDKELTETASLEPVPCSSARGEAVTVQAAVAVVEEDVKMHGSHGHFGILDDASVSPIPPENFAADQAVVQVSLKADGVEGSPTDFINGDHQTQALAMRCNCGKPAVLKTVGHKSQNRGLRYYACEEYKPTFFTRKRNRKRDHENLTSCRFFKWLDSPRVTMEDKKEIRLRKKRQLEQILAAKAVTTNYSTRSSSKHELSEYDAHRNQGLLEGVPPVSGLSVEKPKHENLEDPEPRSKKQKLSKTDPSFSTADSVAFSTRASATRKRKEPCVADTNDKITPVKSSCGDESSHEISVGDWTDSNPRKVARMSKSEADRCDTPAYTYSRRGGSSRPPRSSASMPRAKSIRKMERATADTYHVRKLLPVSLAYQKSREVVLEESSQEEVSGDQKIESNEKGNTIEVCSSEEEGLEIHGCTSAEREEIPGRSRSQIPSTTPRSGQNGKHTRSSGKFEDSRRSLLKVRRDTSGSETSLSGELYKTTNQPSQWIDVPLTCPFENKDSVSKSGVSGHGAVQHEAGEYGPFVGNHDLVVNFPTASHSGERRTMSSNTLLLVKEKAREASLAVNLRRGRSPTTETESQTKPDDCMKKRSERADDSDSDDEETGPSGSRGLRSLKDMLKRENSDGTMADYVVADESQPPYCECKTVKRRAALKTVLSNSANYGLRYWVCVNHRPLFQKKSLWEGDPNDESCKFFRWLDTPIISSAERKKQVAARRRRNQRPS